MIHYAMLIVICVSSQNTNGLPPIGSVDEAMIALRKPATTAREYRDLRMIDHAHGKAIAFLRSSPQTRPEDLVDLLETVLPDRDNPSSRHILELACLHADDAGALRIIEVMRIYGEQSFGVRPISKPAKFDDTRMIDDMVMRTFLRQAKAFVQRMHDPRPLMDLFYDWLMVQQSVKWKYMRRAGDILTTLITLPVSLELRREYALKLMDNYRIMSAFSPAMSELIDDSMLPHMRSLVRQSLDDPETLPIAVARYLADRGDLEVFPVLSQIETKRFGPKLLRGHKPEELSGTLSWRIKVQHPPETLLKWLAMGPSPDMYDHYIGQDARMWLMERAMQLGLDKQAIREAVVTYARRCIPAGHPHTLELPTVKLRAIELGILQPGDLPEIKLPRASGSDQ